jgi:hypothetical protein
MIPTLGQETQPPKKFFWLSVFGQRGGCRRRDWPVYAVLARCNILPEEVISVRPIRFKFFGRITLTMGNA